MRQSIKETLERVQISRSFLIKFNAKVLKIAKEEFGKVEVSGKGIVSNQGKHDTVNYEEHIKYKGKYNDYLKYEIFGLGDFWKIDNYEVKANKLSNRIKSELASEVEEVKVIANRVTDGRYGFTYYYLLVKVSE